LSLLSLNCPSAAVVGREFSVALLCKNHTSQPAALFLQSAQDVTSSAPSGLCVTGLTGSARLGVLQPGETVQTSITVFALACGLFELSGLQVVDKITGTVYPAGRLGCVLVEEA